MSDNETNLSELLSVRLEEVKTSQKVQDGRKMKRAKWRNAYAEIIFEHYEQIDALITSGDTAMSLLDYLQELGVFTCGDYRLFGRAYKRERTRREKKGRGKGDRPILAASPTTASSYEEQNSIVPKRDRKEL